MKVGFSKARLYKGCQHLSVLKDVICTDADTYYKIGGTWSDGDAINYGFTFDGVGNLVWNGESGIIFHITGVSDLSISAVCTITYGLFINDVLVPGIETPHTFTANSKISNISITGFIKLNKGDSLSIYTKVSAGGKTITVNTLFMTLLGDK